MTIHITGTNDLPTGADETITITEDIAYSFSIDDFPSYADADGDTFTSIRMHSFPTYGSITSSGSAIVLDVDYEVGSLTYSPDADNNLSDSFTFSLVDSTGEVSASTYTMTIHITGTSDLPIGSNETISIFEDVPHTFALNDFPGYYDGDGDGLASIRIITDVFYGRITYSGSPISLDTNYPVEGLTYIPDANNITADSFSFSLIDSTGDISASTYTMTISITSVSDLPTGSNETISINEDESYTFDVADFTGYSDGDGDDLESISVTALPSYGDLMYSESVISLNTSYEVASLTYVPDTNSTYNDSFIFRLVDATGAISALTYTMTINVTALNDAPVIGDIPDQSILEGGSFSAIVLDGFISDEETAIESISWDVANNPVHVSVTITDRIANVEVVDEEWNGSETVTFRARDSDGSSITDDAEFTVTEVNDAPDITGQYTVSVAEETLITVLFSYLQVYDPDNEYPTGFTMTILSGSDYTVTGQSVTPNEDVVGDITVPLYVTDSTGANSNTYDLIISVVNDNDAPDVVDIPNQTIDEGGSFEPIYLNTYVSDPDHDLSEISWTYSGDGTNLSVDIDQDAMATITVLDENWYGQQTLRFTASDGALSDYDDVVFTVTAVNDAPVITGQSVLSSNEDESFTISLYSLIVEDIDHTYPSEHTLTIYEGSDYELVDQMITPDENFFGSLYVPVTVSDLGTTNSISNTYYFEVSINPVNDAPIINSQVNTLSTNEDVSIDIALSDLEIIDYDNNSEDFELTLYDGDNYTVTENRVLPDPDYYGMLQVGVSVSDGEELNSESDRFTLSILVISQNDAPEAENFTLTTPEDIEVSINMLLHISDVDENIDLSSLNILIDVSNGSTALDVENSQITYTPQSGFSGTDSFTYEICDEEDSCSSAVVSIIVSNEAPSAYADDVELNEDESATFNVLINDIDPQNNLDANTLAILSEPDNGVVSILEDGYMSYTPNQDYNGTDQLEYQICDQDGYCSSNFVNIEINPVNDSPSILSQSAVQIAEDNSLTLTLNELDVSDDDNVYPDDFVLNILAGDDYTVVGNTITPDQDFFGELNVTVLVNDQQSENNMSEEFGFLITVTPVNDQPEITDQNEVSTLEDIAIEIGLEDLIVDDPDNTYPDDFVLVVMAGLNYTVVGHLLTPAADYSGSLNVPVYVSDQSEDNDRSRIFNLVVEVVSQNDAPVTVDINQSTSENVPLSIDMADMVSDEDGNIDYTSFENISAPQNGTLSVDYTNLLVIYTPEDGFSGSDYFNFRFYDTEELVSNISMVTITVQNEAPNAFDDSVTLDEDGEVTFNVLENDTDLQNNINISSLLIVNNPENGTANVDTSTGEITYIPSENYNGTDYLTYRICDNTLYCDEASVEITVNPVNDSPLTVDDEIYTNEDESVSIDVTSNDSDIDSDVDLFTISVFAQASHGQSVVNSLGQLVYTPATDYNGSDYFEYELCDAEGACSTGAVYVTIYPQNDPPVPQDDQATTTQGQAMVIDVTANDTDIDGNLDITSVTISSYPSNGTAVVQMLTGQITYTPTEGFWGSDSFVYSICDTNGACETASVSIVINESNVAPVCEDDEVQMVDGETVSFDVVTNDSDENGDAITVFFDMDHQLNGVLEINGSIVTYTAVSGEYCIEETLSYQGCDGYSVCDNATLTFIIGVADADNDLIPDFIEQNYADTDGDDILDYLDEDSDNDGISDLLEGGITDACVQQPVDTDGDGIPDYRDLDSDNDGYLDAEEGHDDCDNDGIADFRDDYDNCGERVNAPDTFSPNGDGVNDYFIIQGIEDYEGNEIFIYNRWGGEVFYMKNYDNSWDGKSSHSAIGSSDLSQGLYFYVVKLKGTNSVLKGSVYLKR
jgi:gliding motility-associated-like protein